MSSHCITPWTPPSNLKSPDTPQVSTPASGGGEGGVWSDRYRSWSTGNMGGLMGFGQPMGFGERGGGYERRPVSFPFPSTGIQHGILYWWMAEANMRRSSTSFQVTRTPSLSLHHSSPPTPMVSGVLRSHRFPVSGAILILRR